LFLFSVISFSVTEMVAVSVRITSMLRIRSFVLIFILVISGQTLVPRFVSAQPQLTFSTATAIENHPEAEYSYVTMKYSFTVTNAGTGALPHLWWSGFVLEGQVILPDSCNVPCKLYFDFVSSGFTESYALQGHSAVTVKWDSVNILPGQSFTFSFKVVITAESFCDLSYIGNWGLPPDSTVHPTEAGFGASVNARPAVSGYGSYAYTDVTRNLSCFATWNPSDPGAQPSGGGGMAGLAG
jgi:hypothetical protein